jgi:hypothetical protein
MGVGLFQANRKGTSIADIKDKNQVSFVLMFYSIGDFCAYIIVSIWRERCGFFLIPELNSNKKQGD